MAQLGGKHVSKCFQCIDTWFPYKLNFGAKIWEGGSSPSKKAGVYPCTSKIGCVQSSALVRRLCRRDNGEHNWVQHDFHQRLGTEYDNVKDLPVGRHFTCRISKFVRDSWSLDTSWYIHFLKLICCLWLCAILWYTLIISINLNMFELIRICQDRSGFYPPKSQRDLPRLAQALQTNISLADLWLRGMAIGAASSGRTVQWPWLNWLPWPIRSCSSTSVGNWLMNREFMIISWPPKVLHALSIRCPLRSCLSSSHKCSSNRWDMVGGGQLALSIHHDSSWSMDSQVTT